MPVAAAKGGTVIVDLKLVPEREPLPQLPPLPAAEPASPRNFPAFLPSSNIATDPHYSSKEDPFYEPPKPPKPAEKRGVRFAVTGGVVTVFGVASWNPAVGGVLGGRLSPNEYVSLGIEGRAAWLTSGVGGERISAMTAGGLLSACGHLKWFFGCGLGHLGALSVEFEKETFVEKQDSFFMPGVGARIGTRMLVRSFVLEANADVLRMRAGTKVAIGHEVVEEQPPWMFTAQLGGGWEW